MLEFVEGRARSVGFVGNVGVVESLAAEIAHVVLVVAGGGFATVIVPCQRRSLTALESRSPIASLSLTHDVSYLPGQLGVMG